MAKPRQHNHVALVWIELNFLLKFLCNLHDSELLWILTNFIWNYPSCYSPEREKLRRVHVTTTTTTTTNNQTVLRGGKIVNSAARITGSTSSRVMTKRLVWSTFLAWVGHGLRYFFFIFWYLLLILVCMKMLSQSLSIRRSKIAITSVFFWIIFRFS